MVVPGDVFMKGTEHDHRYHPRQEEHDDKGIHNAVGQGMGHRAAVSDKPGPTSVTNTPVIQVGLPEPLDVGVRHRLQNIVPARGPPNVFVFLEAYQQSLQVVLKSST